MTAVIPETATTEPDRGPSRALRAALIALLAAAALALAGGIGYLARGSGGGSNDPSSASVDAGFAWDMSAHHQQAVSLAGYERDHTTDPRLKILAFDIETSQNSQVGQMQGWLDSWGLPVSNPNPMMSWMAASGHNHAQANGLMPGLATQAEITKFHSLSGTAMDIEFLQLMLRHHQGGFPMVQWAAAHAREAYVRNSAQKMADSQSGEVIVMEGMLRERGASPLPAPE